MEVEGIEKGKVYKNIKHQTLYYVLGFARHSESGEIMVQYERVDPEKRDVLPWDRPLELFKEKFEPTDMNISDI